MDNRKIDKVSPEKFNEILMVAMDKTEIDLEYHSPLFRVGYMKARTDLLIYAHSQIKNQIKN
ncbi:MAG: hypothetical protein GY804_03965 [Alphaproteobacteria bacterium]|nr:hypothetical protein [Alphaproteobacteria bacterium]